MNNLKDPILGEAPFGVFIKGDKATYRPLRNAFNAAQSAWRSFSETPESLADPEKASANVAAWAVLSDQCQTCLTQTSKDLEIFSWFVAAQMHGPNPLSRCASALQALADLVQTNIEDLHPNPPPEKLTGETEAARAAEVAELRLRPFVQLFGEVEGGGLLNGPMSNMPLIGEISYGKFLLAEKDGSLDQLKAQVAGHIGAEAGALTQKIEALQQMSALLPQLDKQVKAYATKHAHSPPLIGYGTRLVADVLRAAALLLDGVGFAWPGQDSTENSAAEQVDAQDGAQAGQGLAMPSNNSPPRKGLAGFDSAANIANRQDALIAIAQLAKYFRTTEPHSPICLLLDRAVRWGNLNAAELYREILSDGSVGMAQMALMTGLESQGFADNFARRGAGAAGGVVHPKLDNYAAAIPVPLDTAPIAARAPLAVTAPAAAKPVAAVIAAPTAAPPEPPAAQVAANLDPNESVQDFQW